MGLEVHKLHTKATERRNSQHSTQADYQTEAHGPHVLNHTWEQPPKLPGVQGCDEDGTHGHPQHQSKQFNLALDLSKAKGPGLIKVLDPPGVSERLKANRQASLREPC